MARSQCHQHGERAVQHDGCSERSIEHSTSDFEINAEGELRGGALSSWAPWICWGTGDEHTEHTI